MFLLNYVSKIFVTSSTLKMSDNVGEIKYSKVMARFD